MDNFYFYFTIGFQHILNFNGMDHILFIMAISLPYTLKDFKKLIWIITAFTLGHTLTLIFSILRIIQFPSVWVEFLISLSILVAACRNLFMKSEKVEQKSLILYFLVFLFGLIHGLGFSYYLRSILGKTTNIAIELIGFNIGLEIGQLIVVSLILLISFVCLNLTHIKRRNWILVCSGGIIGLALQMTIARYPFHV